MVKEGLLRVTLRRIAALAALLARWNRLLAILGAVVGGWLLFELWQVPTATPRLLTALSLFMWIILALGIASALPRPPEPVATGATLAERFGRRVAWVAYALVVVAAMALAALTLAITSRALGFWMS